VSTDPALLSLTEAVAAIRSGKLRSLALVEACLARIERWQPRINAFIDLWAAEAKRAARKADAARKAGRKLGILHGVPLAHKDMYYRKGRISTCGSKIRADWKADRTATVLQRFDAAGALQLGTLNMAEFAFGPTGHNWHFGHARNAWNIAHVTGGSSSGSATAVSARLCYGALGSDTGGSIRMPAMFCGLAGMKPTYGRVSRAGAMPLSYSLDTIGPLARTVADVALLMQVIAGPDPEDPTCITTPAPNYLTAMRRPIKGMRIGIPTSYFSDGWSPALAGAMESAYAQFRRLGAKVIAIDLPDLAPANAFGTLITATEAAAGHANWMRTRPQDYSEQVRARISNGFAVGAVQYLEALRYRASAMREFARVFDHCDALIAPSFDDVAPRIDATDVSAGLEMAPLLARFTKYSRPANFLGLPSLSVPCGFHDGLPLGFQLMGRPFAEAPLIALGHAYQKSTDWHRATPPEA
jgi:aspartyl-tRNA(Asn)/glutamyl-tRNA(Gln) amidotransferase subunit A